MHDDPIDFRMERATRVYPEPREFEVWQGGWSDQGGGICPTEFHGKYTGRSFIEACKAMMTAKGWKWETDGYYHEDQNRYWTGFYDNEAEARASSSW